MLEQSLTPGQQPAPPASRAIRGVITDWGGVLTNSLPEAIGVWLKTERIDRDSYIAALRPWVMEAYNDGAVNPVHALERGECAPAQFERLLAAKLVSLDGASVLAEGLLTRMFAAVTRSEPIYGAIRAARSAGLRTGLLSNSWGDNDYPRKEFPEMFDAVVISGEVGMRKPEERIFLRTAELLGLDPSECVFIDDVPANVAGAEAVGMTGVLHRDPDATLARLGELLGLPLV